MSYRIIELRNIVMIYAKHKSVLKKVHEAYRNGSSKEEIFRDYGATVAVDDVSLSVNRGEILVIMGLSGCGKSSLLKCLNLLNRPVEGEIIVEGDNILDYNSRQLRKLRQEKMTMVFQDFGLLPHKTVLENAMFGPEVSGEKKDVCRQKAMDALKLVGLEGWEDKRTQELSGGMQQRVGFARALANDPEILLMDEPFSALDPLIREQMQDELLQMQASMKKTIVFITHDIGEAIYLGDHVAIMKDGRIQQYGTPREIIEQPKTEYVARFVNSLNRYMDRKEERLSKSDSDPLQEG